jgi:hypothetical protein
LSERPARDWKHSLTVRKRIPSGQQYVPADEVLATVRWDEEGAWSDRFRILNEATAQAVKEWRNLNINQPGNPKPTPIPHTPTAEASESQGPPELSPIASILSADQMQLIETGKVKDVVFVKAKSWLGNEAWRSLHDRLHAAGFRWIPAGKDSRWEIRC